MFILFILNMSYLKNVVNFLFNPTRNRNILPSKNNYMEF